MTAAPTGELLRLHPLRYHVDGEDVVVGRVDTDSYGLFPPDGAALVRTLADGGHPAEAARWYETEYGQQVDMAEFMETLAELDFIDHAPAAPRQTHRVRFQRLGQALFSTPAWLLYLGLFAAAAVIATGDARFAPWRPLNVFYTDYLVLIEITLFLVQPLLMLLHESFHALAARRLGLNSTLSVSRRLYFLGFETALDGLVVVPRRQRYLPMLAGMLCDLLVMAALTVLAWVLTPAGEPLGFAARLCVAVAFTSLPRLLFQCYFFMRTDIYYLIVNVLGCHDLQTTTRELVANAWWRWRGQPDRIVDGEHWHPRDLQVARWYAPIFVTGYAVMIAAFFLITLPIGWRFGTAALHALTSADTTPARFWDAVVLATMTAIQFGFTGYLGVRDWRRRRAHTHHGGER